MDSLGESFGGTVKAAWEARSSGKGPAVQRLRYSQVANAGERTDESKSGPAPMSGAGGQEPGPRSCLGMAVRRPAPAEPLCCTPQMWCFGNASSRWHWDKPNSGQDSRSIQTPARAGPCSACCPHGGFANQPHPTYTAPSQGYPGAKSL